MPDRPYWSSNLEKIQTAIAELPDPTCIDRASIEKILRISPRRAQQILSPCVTRQIGRAGVTDAQTLLARLRSLTTGVSAKFENSRRHKLAAKLSELETERKSALLVEAPNAIVNTQLEDLLPAGVSIEPGEIRVVFTDSDEALRKLLALAMAIKNDQDGWERMASK